MTISTSTRSPAAAGTPERPPQRIAVVATASGSGKTTVARRLSMLLDLPHTELDAIHHQANWVPLDAAEFVAAVAPIVATERWVIDGNYQGKLGDLVLARAELVIWLDLPRRVWLPRLLRRTARRVVARETLWNGNRESLRGALFDREGVIWYALLNVRRRRAAYPERLAGYPTRRLRTQAEVEALLAELEAGGATTVAADR